MSPHRGMEQCQLLGRSELIAWVNAAIGVNIERIEQCCNGAIYIQLLDLVHPGRVPLARVKFNAALEYEYLANYKVLQTVFTKLGIAKHIDVQKLTRGKYQDNLEFLQWIRGYVDANRTVETVEYDGPRRRVTAVIRNCIANNTTVHLNLGSVTNALPHWAQEGVTVPLIKECLASVKATPQQKTEDNNRAVPSDTIQAVRRAHSITSSTSGHDAKTRRVDQKCTQRSQHGDTCSRTSTADTHNKDTDSVKGIERTDTVTTNIDTAVSLHEESHKISELESLLESQRRHSEKLNLVIQEHESEITQLKQQIERQKEQIDNLKKQLGQAQAEKQVAKMSKDFYYNKLRRIEILCQKNENGQCEVSALFDIMYATDNVI
ncbi:Microtubule-associated protein RP/EB family member 1C [Babesia sp. Xinjiang]|uniref:Microtubule-associated protein RP/EB family member 1C n=1 Tax=Babesia sp. Xinjiang TaxID=462227 RepID=UPI000A246C60|nr:Microtubule-associated protein RP/EB family member 1C [Babesia sp. Xinjiang]ORM42243.1 Microtubule-associated protein RP/EB family member 1C [Babesia sp. Xinjiang]